MDKFKKYTQKLPFLLIVVLVTGFVIGIINTYQNRALLSMEDKPGIMSEVNISEDVYPEDTLQTKENSEKNKDEIGLAEEIAGEGDSFVNGLNNDEVLARKQALASQDLSSRKKPTTSAEAKEGNSAENQGTQGENTQKQITDADRYDTTLNGYVLNVIKGYSSGHYPYILNNDYENYNGVTVNLYYKNRVLLKAHPSGNKASHCSGITFEVFFKAMQNRNKQLGLSSDDFNGMNYEELYDFVLTWYAAKGSKSSNNVAVAVEKYGIGRRITHFADAKAGDFMDISRENNTGHTVVFKNWIWDSNGRIIGFKYWSSQESTNGISHKEEYFNIAGSNGNKYGNVMIDQVYIARVSPVKEYK